MKNIILITGNRDTFSNPVLVELLRKLTEREFSITIAAPTQDIPIPPFAKGFLFLPIPHNFIVVPKNPFLILRGLLHYWRIIQVIRRNKTTEMLVVDPSALIIGQRLKKFLATVRLHYLSFEIFFFRETAEDKFFSRLKKREPKCLKSITSLVIQDTVRKQLLMDENGIEKIPKTFFVPVAYPKLEATLNGKEYRDRLGIQPFEICILHSGTVSNWSGIEIIIEAIELGLPAGFKIVVHSRFPLNPENFLHRRLITLSQTDESLVLHDDVFDDFNEYIEFVRSFDVGLALYLPDDKTPYTGRNIEEIGLASGKFSTYISCDMPVISTPNQIYIQLNNKYKFGELVRSGKELIDALPKIVQKVDLLSLHALYANELDPTRGINAFMDYIERCHGARVTKRLNNDTLNKTILDLNDELSVIN